MTKLYKIILFSFLIFICGNNFAQVDSGIVNIASNEVLNENSNMNFDEINESSILDSVIGIASFYGKRHHGKKCANGETFDMNAFTAAHKNYPFGTIVKVTNLKNLKSVILEINDRLPKWNKRVIDISFKAAQDLEMIKKGIQKVKVEVLKWGE